MKQDRILKLSEFKERLLPRNKNTLLIDEYSQTKIYRISDSKIFKQIKKIILKDGLYLHNTILNNFYNKYPYDYNNPTLRKIIFSKNENLDLDGITIDYDIALKSDMLCIKTYNDFTTNKVNIVFNNIIESIECPRGYNEVIFTTQNDTLKITISNYNEDNIILANCNGIIKKYTEYKNIELSNEYLVNSKLDLHMYSKYKNIIIRNNDVIEQLILDNNIIGKNVSFYGNSRVNVLEFIDSDMKLIPENKTISIYGDLYIIENSDNVLSLFAKSNENKMINLYKNGDVQIIDGEYIRNNFDNIQRYEIFINNNFSGAIVEHGKKDNFTILIGDKKYKITNGLKKYLYKNYSIQKENWFDIFGYDCFGKLNIYEFKELYSEYIKIMNRLKNLKDLGISNKILYYAYTIDFNENKDLRLFKGLKQMMQYESITKNEAEKIEQFGKILIKDIKNNRK